MRNPRGLVRPLPEFLLHVAPVRPVFIWGAPGIGKSALVAQFAEVVFCDAAPYDQGYMAPEEIADRVEVRGDRAAPTDSGPGDRA